MEQYRLENKERMGILQLEVPIEHDRLFRELEERCPQVWSPTHPTLQQAIQYDPLLKNGNPLLDACGSLGSGMRDSQFSHFLDHLSGSYTEKVLTSLPWRVTRARFMRLTPKSCYSVHRDEGWRVHIPLVTNSQSHFAFFDRPAFHHLAPGKVYVVDTTRMHTYLNGGLSDRVHIVASLPTNWQV